MREVLDTFEAFRASLVKGLHTIAVGRIVSCDGKTADVETLPDKNLLTNVAIAHLQTEKFVIRMPYKKGDLVLVGFAMNDIESVMFGDDVEPTTRMHSQDDSFILLGLNLFTKPLPDEHLTDLVIASKDYKHKIVLSETGDTTVKNDNYLFALSADGDIEMSNIGQAKITMTKEGGITIDGPDGVSIRGKTTSGSW